MLFIVNHAGVPSVAKWVRLGDSSSPTPNCTTCSEGGGGCPFVDTRTASGWEEENSVLGRSLGGAPMLDVYRLKTGPQPRSGRYELRMRENEQEVTTLDAVKLLAVDHSAEERAFVYGDQPFLGTSHAAFRVTTTAGLDVTGAVTGGEAPYEGQPGDTLMVQLEASAPARRFGVIDSLISGGKDTSAVLVEVWSRYKYVYGQVPPITGAADIDSQPTDRWVLGSTGILVQSPDSLGQWRTVAHHYPRHHADGALIRVPANAPLRLVFVGQHQVSFLGRVTQSSATPELHSLGPVSANHSRLGDVLASVVAEDGRAATIVPDDTLAVSFAAPPLAPERARDWFLISRGAYTSNLSSVLRQDRETSDRPGFGARWSRINPTPLAMSPRSGSSCRPEARCAWRCSISRAGTAACWPIASSPPAGTP